jgi:hypothetical protein
MVEVARDVKLTKKLSGRMSTGGGVAIIHRAEFKVKRLTTLPRAKTFEFVCCRLNAERQGDVVILSVYRPGSKPVTGEFFSEFTALLESLATFRCTLLLLGDLNIHLERSCDVHANELLELLESFDLYQWVKQPTHVKGGLLDVVITRQSDCVSDIKITETGLSDHALITGRLPIPCSRTETASVEGRKWNDFSVDAFRTDLLNSILCSGTAWTDNLSIDELFDTYNSELTAVLDRHAPRYVCRRKRRALTPWFDGDCRRMKRKVRVLERKYRKSNIPADRLAWVKKLEEQSRFYREKERLYWLTRINANSSNARRLWRDLDDLMRRDDDGSSSTASCTPEEASRKADDFLKFFENKVDAVRIETEGASPPVFQSTDGTKFTRFQHTTPDQIIQLVNKSQNKHCSLDPVPTNVVKNCIDLLAPFICVLFNRSLDEGYLPQSQKVANIIPHLKKRGLDEADHKSYRPVSNLSFISKLLERIIAQQLNDFLSSTNALPAFQSAYRRNHSTETALLKVFSDVCRAIDDGNTCLLGLLDLSAAFDTVDHDILLTRLEKTFGICDAALQWFRSYLTDRLQAVRLAGRCSRLSKLKFGVPQGSVLGPILFLLYSAPVVDIITRHGLMTHCYADDTQVYFYCPPDQTSSLLDRFTRCIADVEQWMKSNRLKLNCDKTEMLWLASRYGFRSMATVPSVTVGNTVVQPANGARNLGCYFDRNLNMKQHITNVCRLCYFQLRQLRVIRRTLPAEVLKTLLHAFVSSRLDYCNSLFYGLPQCELQKLQRVQNAAARLFGGLRKYDHISPILRDKLHWLPIQQRVDFKIALLTYKSLHQMAPGYLQQMFHPVAQSQNVARNRSASRGDLLPQSWNTVAFGQRGFDYSAPIVWNSIPTSVRNCDSLTTFKKSLKTHLFRKAYFNN